MYDSGKREVHPCFLHFQNMFEDEIIPGIKQFRHLTFLLIIPCFHTDFDGGAITHVKSNLKDIGSLISKYNRGDVE